MAIAAVVVLAAIIGDSCGFEIGGIVWGVGFVLLGFLAGNSWETVASTVGRTAAYIVVGVLLALLIVWQIRKHRSESVA